MKSFNSQSLRFLVVSLAALALATACAATHQARDIKTTGFLRDYSQMSAGEDGQAQLRYVSPQARFSNYKKIILDPIKVYSGGQSGFGELSPEDMRRLLDYFDATLRENLKSDYQFVNRPGPDVMRIRVAMVGPDASNVPLDTISSILPITVALSALKSAAVGSGIQVGSAGVECEIQDSQTGQRLAAFVDRQVGRKYTGRFDKFNEWHAVQSAFDFWAERMKAKLTELRTNS